jgi:hypothetical protein
MINEILKIRNGSHLYGTNTENSDLDFSGVFISDETHYFGLEPLKEIDNSIVVKLNTGKNSKDAIDDKLFELKRFVSLAMQNNPNIIEHLFCNTKNIISSNYYGQELLRNAHLFPNKGSFDKFMGYANSQKHKMVIKEKNFEELHTALEYFGDNTLIGSSLIVEHREQIEKYKLGKENQQHFLIGDLNFQKTTPVKKVFAMLTDRVSKISNRYELVTKYGYDTKFASHLIRLLTEGCELLHTGQIKFPLQNKNLILSIKKGEYKIDEILKMSEYYESQLAEAYVLSGLPEKPDFDEINKLTIKLIKLSMTFGESF